VQLNIDNANGILASDIVLTYDPEVVALIDISTTSLTSNNTLVYNALEDKVIICLYGVESMIGSGAMLDFKFSPVRNTVFDISDAIALSRIQFNDGAYAANIKDVVSIKEIPTSYGLLQNYPNPFNPETWIPFNLPKATDVSIQIYDLSGKLVRKLDLGKKPGGSYLTKTEAAYWDGKNNLGERVASGIYYYQLKAGAYRAVKKMIILK
jgi:hypothetical protein